MKLLSYSSHRLLICSKDSLYFVCCLLSIYTTFARYFSILCLLLFQVSMQLGYLRIGLFLLEVIYFALLSLSILSIFILEGRFSFFSSMITPGSSFCRQNGNWCILILRLFRAKHENTFDKTVTMIRQMRKIASSIARSISSFTFAERKIKSL